MLTSFIKANLMGKKIKIKAEMAVEKTKTEIFNLLHTEANLRSKRELIERFILEVLGWKN